MDHPGDDVLQSLTLGALTTAQSLEVQRHIYNCPDCLKRLIATEVLLAIADADDPPRSLKPDISKPLYLRHDTADGFIYLRVERQGHKWIECHWGDQLNGGAEYATLREANVHALSAFAQMFPEHRCTERCCFDPSNGPAPQRK